MNLTGQATYNTTKGHIRTLYIQPGDSLVHEETTLGKETMTIGENIRRAREAKGLTQREVWEATGISESSYKSYEKGERPPPGDKIVTLARLLGVSTDDLLLDEAERDVSDDLRAIFVRFNHLPAEEKVHAKIALRGILMSYEQEALR
ncbi:helix-turn-helix domain-containing protein, partial [Pseudomonas aeruginosa]|uniref:helix-turn-helix domain-containing protein n=3 Tax=Pseudomonas aeruginosa TaxID=287 RepID=UPI001F550C9C